MVAGDAERDPEEPRAKRRATLEGIEPSVDDHEHLLNDVVERGVANAKTFHATPDEAEKFSVDILEGRIAPGFDRGRCRTFDAGNLARRGVARGIARAIDRL